MSIDLTNLHVVSAGPVPFRLGATVRGPLGGSQRINRLGDRWMMAIETPPYEIEPNGRQWSALIEQAQREGALLRVRQPGAAPMIVGSPVADAATATGRSVPISGLQPGAAIRLGQWVSIIVDGQRFLDKVAQQVVASEAGTATLTLANLVRRPIPAGAIVELADPKIEGSIENFAGSAWSLDGLTTFAFTVIEDD